jgi:hypothetical protein
MIRTLLIVAAAGAVWAAVCFGGAAAVGWRPDLSGWNFDGGWDGDHDSRNGGAQTTRDIPWQGGERLTFNFPGTVHYTQGPETKVTVTGPERAIEAIGINGGVFTLPHHRWAIEKFDIEVTAPGVARFNVNGPADLTIDNYAQDELRIEVNGPGNIIARGAARRVEATLRGPGEADLSAVAGDEARVEIMGPGDARIAPKKFADVTIMGPGIVYLENDTAQVRSRIMGPGEVRRSPAPAPSASNAVNNGAEEKRRTSSLPAAPAAPALPAAPADPPPR